MGDHAPILLHAAHHFLEVDPDYGGRITGFWSDLDGARIDWLVATPPDGRSVSAPYSSGSFPLTPFSNRIRGGQFSFAGNDYRIAATERGKPHAIHGHGCRQMWQVEDRSDTAVRLSYQMTEGDWPFPYRAVQIIALTAAGAEITIGVENIGPTAMPVGLGHHPYFPCDDDTWITTGFKDVWPAVADSIPDGPEPLPDDLDFRAGAKVPSGLDTGFGGWTGSVLIEWRGQGRSLRLDAGDDLSHAVIYSPAGKGFFCFEPVSHAINAFNLKDEGVPGTGYRILAPKQVFSQSIQFATFCGNRVG